MSHKLIVYDSHLAGSLANRLGITFTWDETIEGQRFWEDIFALLAKPNRYDSVRPYEQVFYGNTRLDVPLRQQQEYLRRQEIDEDPFAFGKAFASGLLVAIDVDDEKFNRNWWIHVVWRLMIDLGADDKQKAWDEAASILAPSQQSLPQVNTYTAVTYRIAPRQLNVRSTQGGNK